MRTPRTSLLLLPGGLALGHAFGYVVAGDGHHRAEAVGHGWLGVLVRLAVPLALGALAWSFLGGARELSRRDLRWQRLALQQMALFLAVEVLEHGLAGYGPAHVLHAPTTLWGVVGQVLAAYFVTQAVGAAYAAGRRVAPRRPTAPPRTAVRRFPRPAAARAVARDVAATWALLRAPPASLPA
jgi:hypothetical protein